MFSRLALKYLKQRFAEHSILPDAKEQLSKRTNCTVIAAILVATHRSTYVLLGTNLKALSHCGPKAGALIIRIWVWGYRIL